MFLLLAKSPRSEAAKDFKTTDEDFKVLAECVERFCHDLIPPLSEDTRVSDGKAHLLAMRLISVIDREGAKDFSKMKIRQAAFGVMDGNPVPTLLDHTKVIEFARFVRDSGGFSVFHRQDKEEKSGRI